MTVVVVENEEAGGAPSEVILRWLPQLEGWEVWSALTQKEQNSWTLALGAATNWVVEQVQSSAATTGLRANFANLLEEVASSNEPETVNAVMVSALELLPLDDPAFAGLVAGFGPRTNDLLAEMNRLWSMIPEGWDVAGREDR